VSRVKVENNPFLEEISSRSGGYGSDREESTSKMKDIILNGEICFIFGGDSIVGPLRFVINYVTIRLGAITSRSV
jgi:hypothetical protein